MLLGPFAFEALGFGYQDVTREIDTAHAEIPLAGGLNATQWTGPGSDEVTIRGVVFAQFGGQATLDALAQEALSGRPLMLVSGTAGAGLISGYFTVQSVREERSLHDASGSPARNAYTIKLRRLAAGPGQVPGSDPGGLPSRLLDLF
ncbi:phage tail protein [Pannonibacter sp. P2PFMT1]|uniref:phage tail protein n=1 Tax=Pannonibacter sp. P2PFMT1 TaxID=2003582 RepID=UPI001FCBA2E9|nr:phage tail protein [Pannonibacter sp. P2PFMT1]